MVISSLKPLSQNENKSTKNEISASKPTAYQKLAKLKVARRRLIETMLIKAHDFKEANYQALVSRKLKIR